MINEPLVAFDDADARSIVDMLWSSWPVLAMLRPADLSMDGSPARAMDFVRAVQSLSDAGLLSYEAFVIGPSGPHLVEAALTARGRAMLGSWMHTQGAVLRQAAG